MSIKLQFSKSRGIGAELICWRDWSDYSHVDTVMPDGRLFGARGDGVKHREPYPVIRKLIIRIDVNEEQEKKYYEALLSQEGKPYDYFGLLGFVFNRDWQETDKWICSELKMWALLQADIHILRLETIKTLNRISPQIMLYSPIPKV